MKSKLATKLSTCPKYNDKEFEFADGYFSWSADLNELILSQSVGSHLSRNFEIFQDSIPEDFFINSHVSEKNGFFEKKISFFSKSNKEMIILFRYKGSEDMMRDLAGIVLIINNETALDSIGSIYQSMSLRALSSSFAHEINNPLALISSVADWITIRLDKSDVDILKFGEKIITIKNSIQRIQTLIRGIESSAKGFEFSCEAFYVNIAVQRVSKVFAKRLQNHQITIDIALGKEVGVAGDPQLITQVIFNVFSSVVALAVEQRTKHVSVSSVLKDSSVELIFKVQGTFEKDEAAFHQSINSEIISSMLSSESGSFKRETKAESVEFRLKLKREV